MTIGTAQLSEALQTLVDARLDTIDRMLLGRVPRGDRVAIVREVESQVFELLHGRDAEELTREDVLAVLGRLDPPEAYLPEEDESETGSVRTRTTFRTPRPATASNKPFRVAKAGGILGLSSIGMVLFSPLGYLLAALTQSEMFLMIVLFLMVVLTFTAGLMAIVFGIIGRRDPAWAVTGAITGAMSLLIAALGGIFLLIETSQ